MTLASTDLNPPGAPAGPVRPTVRFLWSHPAHLVALGFGSGLSPWAAGTVGTLWAWLSFVVLDPWLSDRHWAAVLVLGALVGWWACTVTARHLRSQDPGCIVWDEILAFWAVLWVVTPASGEALWSRHLAAFILFRAFDALKVGPIGWADRAFKGGGWRGGFGILWDDIVAALCTLLVIALWVFVTA
ncbi:MULTISPECIES: phosphatidylglycerophosphatase A [Caldimonas]|uniref:phosphatidylglycerophosphatase A family protein n=1 Tax=Caldimonas TaxID=196013 RepID=UPI0007828A1D|nr:phosphatidylglycerophosphatase A [Caldimonas taiwanensis]